FAEPASVRFITCHGHVSLRPIEEVAAHRLRLSGPRGCATRCLGKSSSAGTKAGYSDLRLSVGDPMADFELQYAALPARKMEFKGTVQNVRRLLIVVEHEVSAAGGNLVGQLNPESPPCQVNLMDTLVAEVTIACVPDPVPVVMKTVARKRLHRSGTSPQIV